MDELLNAEGYVASSLSVPQALSYIRSEIEKRWWSADSSGQLTLLYLLGKYKSLRKRQWLWRGITSLPQPLLPKKTLRIAARANSAFLKRLCNCMTRFFFVPYAQGVMECTRENPRKLKVHLCTA